MPVKSFIIDPDAKLKYGFDWSSWLASGATIVNSFWSITTENEEDNAELTYSNYDNTSTFVWVTGCTAGRRYVLTNSIVDSLGQKDDRSITLLCRQR